MQTQSQTCAGKERQGCYRQHCRLFQGGHRVPSVVSEIGKKWGRIEEVHDKHTHTNAYKLANTHLQVAQSSGEWRLRIVRDCGLSFVVIAIDNTQQAVALLDGGFELQNVSAHMHAVSTARETQRLACLLDVKDARSDQTNQQTQTDSPRRWTFLLEKLPTGVLDGHRSRSCIIISIESPAFDKGCEAGLCHKFVKPAFQKVQKWRVKTWGKKRTPCTKFVTVISQKSIGVAGGKEGCERVAAVSQEPSGSRNRRRHTQVSSVVRASAFPVCAVGGL